MGNSAVKAVASVSNGFGLSIPTGVSPVIFRISCVKCTSGRTAPRGARKFAVHLTRSSRILRRMRVVTCNGRDGVSIATTVSSVDGGSLLESPDKDITGTLSKTIAKLSSMRISNRPKTRSPSVCIQNAKSLSSRLSGPLVLISKIRHSFFRVSLRRVRDVAILGSTTSATIFNMHNTGKIILIAAQQKATKGPGVSLGSSFNLARTLHGLGKISDCACTALCGRARLDSGPSLGRSRLNFSPCIERVFEAGTSPVVFPGIS